jgi:hypothetical protein
LLPIPRINIIVVQKQEFCIRCRKKIPKGIIPAPPEDSTVHVMNVFTHEDEYTGEVVSVSEK